MAYPDFTLVANSLDNEFHQRALIFCFVNDWKGITICHFMSLKLISNNAYRLLGVVATASKKDIERNKSKFNAFLRVNRPVPIQPLDFLKLLTEVQRDLDTISKAEGEISIPAGQLTHGMFWFVSTGHVDEECFQSLSNGNIDEAVTKWKSDGKKGTLGYSF